MFYIENMILEWLKQHMKNMLTSLQMNVGDDQLQACKKQSDGTPLDLHHSE